MFGSIREDLACMANLDTAKEYLEHQLPRLAHCVADTFKRIGMDTDCAVSYFEKAFVWIRESENRIPAFFAGRCLTAWMEAYHGMDEEGSLQKIPTEE